MLLLWGTSARPAARHSVRSEKRNSRVAAASAGEFEAAHPSPTQVGNVAIVCCLQETLRLTPTPPLLTMDHPTDLSTQRLMKPTLPSPKSMISLTSLLFIATLPPLRHLIHLRLEQPKSITRFCLSKWVILKSTLTTFRAQSKKVEQMRQRLT